MKWILSIFALLLLLTPGCRKKRTNEVNASQFQRASSFQASVLKITTYGGRSNNNVLIVQLKKDNDRIVVLRENNASPEVVSNALSLKPQTNYTFPDVLFSHGNNRRP